MFSSVSSLLQPDFGQAVLMYRGLGAMLLVYGIPWIVILGLGGSGIAGVCVGLHDTFPHVASRIDRFLDPDKGDTFQVDTARQAFENGGCFGTGPGGGSAKHILPDAHTDFIFAVVGEEFGLIACLVLIGLVAFIIAGILRRAAVEAERLRDAGDDRPVDRLRTAGDDQHGRRMCRFCRPRE